MITSNHDIDLSRFEGLGNNCEFGFVCRKLHHETGSFFRWTDQSINSVSSLLEEKFEGIFAFDNLEPSVTVMVRDRRYGISFHSEIHSIRDASNQLVWIKDELWRREKRKIEYGKIEHLRAKFTQRSRQEGVCYVLKSPGKITEAALSRLQKAIIAFGGHSNFSILVVGTADATNAAGTVIPYSGSVYRGFVDFFAPGERADNVDMKAWTRVLSQAP